MRPKLRCLTNPYREIESGFLRIFGQARIATSQLNSSVRLEQIEDRLEQLEKINDDQFKGSLMAFGVPAAQRRPAPVQTREISESINSIVQAVAEYFNPSIVHLDATSRIRSIVLPRQIAMYLVRKKVGISFAEIGKFFGGRDHSTVMRSYQRILESTRSSGLILEITQAIEKSIGN